MHRFARKIVFGAIISVFAAGSALAAGDPAVGTWTLNGAKSHFSKGHGLKSETRTYTEGADGTSLSISGIAEDGSTITQSATWKYDGKDYPVMGWKNADTISLTKVNGSTVTSTLKSAGKPVATTTRTISGHGKILTLTTKSSDDKGHKYTDVDVFDKQ
jgi:hypothetical protein